MTNTQRLGIFFVTAGSLIVLCVIAAWFIPPLLVPPSIVTSADNQLPSSPISAPALLPYFPPAPSESLDNSIAESPLLESPSSILPSEKEHTPPGKSNFDVISYAEIMALGTHDRSQDEQTFRLAIPALDIDAPVETVSLKELQDSSGRQYRQWPVPEKYAVGWHDTSAPPGQTGNTVINGHNNIHGSVFGNLVDLTLGEEIILYEGEKQHVYQVIHREFLLERGEPLRTRLRNARWIAPSEDKRLTIVTCWPNSTNSHRLVVIAQPLSLQPGY